jgi:16S rRNA (adenine1518-N6/adenine1519-N6)-dimethyltransferase
MNKIIKPKQSLGQNFLVDDNIARKIVRSLNINESNVIIEIGPGLGSLTKHIVGRAKHFIAVEVDRRAANYLLTAFSSDEITILNKDFLEINLAELQQKYNSKLRLVGNIPYHLTSPILFKAFAESKSIRDLTIMIQQEVAERIVGKPNTKEYGIPSVLSQFYGTPKRLFNVSSNCFYPKPKVISTVIQIMFHDSNYDEIDQSLFVEVVKTTFGKRRKTLRNSLTYLPYDKFTIRKVITELDFPLEKRPEQLSVKQFVLLAKQIKSLIG